MVQLELERNCSKRNRSKFQFHYGSIRTLNVAYGTELAPTNFNSIMVQLEQGRIRCCNNSTEFQFHYGSIRTYLHLQCICKPRISIPLWFNQNTKLIDMIDKTYNFNSIMVQLELRPITKVFLLKLISIPLWFNQNYLLSSMFLSVSYFNSIMVQLELTSRNLRVSKYLFQFHYGSIRTLFLLLMLF